MKLDENQKRKIINDIKNDINAVDLSNVKSQVISYSLSNENEYALKTNGVWKIKTLLFLVSVFVVCTIIPMAIRFTYKNSNDFLPKDEIKDISFKDYCSNTNACELFVQEFLYNGNISTDEIELTQKQKEIINYVYFLTNGKGMSVRDYIMSVYGEFTEEDDILAKKVEEYLSNNK